VNKPPIPVAKPEQSGPVEPPPENPAWHPVALLWYRSLAPSAQSTYYEASDWALAFVLAESMSREFADQPVGTAEDGSPVMAALPPKAASVAAWLKGMTALLVTEGDRRRLQVEVSRRESAPSEEAVALLDEYRHRRGAS
jgi:hypothetical protein